MTSTRPEGEARALLSHLEPLLARRAVLVLGPPEALAAARDLLSARGLEATCAPSEDGLAPGAFGLVLLLDGGASTLDSVRVASLRARVAPGGWLAVPVSPDAADAEPVLRRAFPVVQAASIVPFSGWAVVPDGARPGDVTWDGSAPGALREAARLLLCGDAPAAPRGATVVALPAAGPAPAPPAVPAPLPDLAAAARDALADDRAAEASEDALLGSWGRR